MTKHEIHDQINANRQLAAEAATVAKCDSLPWDERMAALEAQATIMADTTGLLVKLASGDCSTASGEGAS